MTAQKPWEIHSDLQAERLEVVGKILKDVRHDTLALHDPDAGDDVWSLGCRIYERTINTFQRAGEHIQWLNFKRKGLYFVLFIGQVPIRFYRGEYDKPNSRSLSIKFPELESQQLAFPFDRSTWFWRVVVETDIYGEVTRIVIAQFSESEESRNKWEIQLDQPATRLSGVANKLEDSVRLEKPSVSFKVQTGKKSEVSE